MSELWNKYVNDKRDTCKYGSKCFQKNPEHHKKYKHPPKRGRDDVNRRDSKRVKLDCVHRPASPIEDTKEASETVPKLMNVTGKVIIKTPEKLYTRTYNKDVKFHDVPTLPVEFISEVFELEMPDDFYSFWNFLKSLSTNDKPENCLKKVNLEPVGAFDALTGRLPVTSHKQNYFLHWRYYYDPPEFQTVLRCTDRSGYHLGYYRDCPHSEPVFVAANDSSKDAKIVPLGGNLFAALSIYLESTKKKSPFISIHCQKLLDQVKVWTTTHKIDLEPTDTKKRQKQIVARTFHGAGIVVPYDKKTQVGYRPLIEKDAKLMEILDKLRKADSDSDQDKALSALQPIITMANIAIDECDYGTALELGLDFFSSGIQALDGTTQSLLCTAYSMLNRDIYGEIVKVHLANRRKGTSLSISDL